MGTRKRYAVVGLGSRSAMFTSAILDDFADRAELVGLCDINPGRMETWNRFFKESYGAGPFPAYPPGDFERMIGETRVDTVIVTSMDRTHHHYIARAMEAGCDVISEKPMTIDEEKCAVIYDAIRKTGRKLRVTFNYRYAPRNSRVKELLLQGVIGAVKSVHFEWLLDTRHGADYFRRWHRDKRNSGGLMVHKATHHFDLVNWWIDSEPVSVYALGDLAFYGRENAEARGVTSFYDRATGQPAAAGDPFALDLSTDEKLKQLYLDQEAYDGYRRDQSVFGDGISIEDDMGVLVKYRNGAHMSYHLTAYSPWEGFRIAFNGTRGRLEYDVVETTYVSGSQDDVNSPEVRDAREFASSEPVRIVVRPLWNKPYEVSVESVEGVGHGGGDKRLLLDIFAPEKAGPDPLRRAADHIAGARSILVGIAANRSFRTGQAVRIKDVFDLSLNRP